MLVIIGIIILISLVVFYVWAGLNYKSMWYELREDEMSWKRGVWFRRRGVVPYNRITNLDVKQGPVIGALGISTLAVQTAGYSGQAVPEIRIEGMDYAEELHELIRMLVRQPAANGDGTGGVQARAQTVPLTTDQKVLDELVRIRQLLETQRK